MDLSNISILAVLGAAFAGMVSGAAWYGLLSKPWMKAVGYSVPPEPDPKIYIVAAISQLILAYMLAVLFRHFPDVGMMDGILAAFFCWLGFCVTPMAVNHRFQSKGWDLTLIDGGYWLLVFILQGAILGWMGS